MVEMEIGLPERESDESMEFSEGTYISMNTTQKIKKFVSFN